MSALRQPVRTPEGLSVRLIDLGPGHGMCHMRTLAVGGCLIQAEALRQEHAVREAARAQQAQTAHEHRKADREAYNAAQRRYWARRKAAQA